MKPFRFFTVSFYRFVAIPAVMFALTLYLVLT